ncbi:MAG: large conductance mechanosensitive channel protein MscL [Planctomycetota bacterium]|nr:MAG: large conductance mechanosensitive channel protein MscL [Planctomycetota bacterium]
MSVINEFQKFILRGNLVDMAIGFTVGAAFTSVAKSLVNNLIMPPVGLLLGGADFSDLFIVLRPGSEELPPYSTLKEAQEAGAVTLNYGLFINDTIALLIVAAVMFFLIRAINRIDEALDARLGTEKPAADVPSTKKCPFCRETIAYLAIRCPHCTSELETDLGGAAPAPPA